MQIQTDVPMSKLTTMRLGGPAHFVITVTTKKELEDAIEWADRQQVPVLALGAGSNMIVRDEGFKGLIILVRISGFEAIADDASSTTIRVGAGENWDSVVERSVNMRLSGIEALSAIPGTAGATPVQNVGAYGQEIAQTFVELEAYDFTIAKFVRLSHDDLQFSYRNSVLKPMQNRRYIITSITLKLRKAQMQPPFYARLQTYLDENGITDYSPASIRKAVAAIRARILPDPSVVANTGSFFKNPIVTQAEAKMLTDQNPGMPHWDMPDGRVKLAAGWMVDQAGLRGYQSHGMQTYENNALVFVNNDAKSYSDLAAFQAEVVAKVKDLFGVTLEQEPELL